MKKFSSFEKAFLFASLAIEGTFGMGLTYSDFTQYDKPIIEDMLKCYGKCYIVVRETGTQNGNGIIDEGVARVEASRWYNAKNIIKFEIGEENNVILSSIKL